MVRPTIFHRIFLAPASSPSEVPSSSQRPLEKHCRHALPVPPGGLLAGSGVGVCCTGRTAAQHAATAQRGCLADQHDRRNEGDSCQHEEPRVQQKVQERDAHADQAGMRLLLSVASHAERFLAPSVAHACGDCCAPSCFYYLPLRVAACTRLLPPWCAADCCIPNAVRSVRP